MSQSSKGETSADLLRKENADLRQVVDELTVLNELAHAIGSSDNITEIIDEIIRHTTRLVDARQTVIVLIDRDTFKDHGALADTSGAENDVSLVQLDPSIVEWIRDSRTPLLSNNPQVDKNLASWDCKTGVHSILSVPLLVNSEVTGVLTALNKNNSGRFDENDQSLLVAVASQSVRIIENSRQHEAEKNLLLVKEQLELSERIQKHLLPKGPPDIPGYDITGLSESALEVGGDYYDYIRVDDNRWVLCLGDVSGKGLPAALLMANLQAIMRAQNHAEERISACVSFANQMLCRSTPVDKFVTLFCARLDLVSNQLYYCSAGHEPSIFLQSGKKPLELPTGGMLVGISEQALYKEDYLQLEPGDVVVCYSDGVTDAENRAEEPFGKDRLLDLLSECSEMSAQEILDTVQSAVKKHTTGMAQLDDITMMVIKRRA